MLKKGVDASFNCTTVDSDTSTSDTVLLIATGQAKHPRIPPADGNAARNRMLADFARALNELLLELALQVIRDGEGAQKLVRIDVTGATNARSAKKIAMAVANSPLVKTAIAGEDANWGRIVMAVGKSGEPADRDKLSIGVGGVWMARDGGVVPGYDEAPVVAHMKGLEVEIAIDIGLGRGQGDGLDLRPDARLHRHQRILPELTASNCPGRCVRHLRCSASQAQSHGRAFLHAHIDLQQIAVHRNPLLQASDAAAADSRVSAGHVVHHGDNDAISLRHRGEQHAACGSGLQRDNQNFFQRISQQGCAHRNLQSGMHRDIDGDGLASNDGRQPGQRQIDRRRHIVSRCASAVNRRRNIVRQRNMHPEA